MGACLKVAISSNMFACSILYHTVGGAECHIMLPKTWQTIHIESSHVHVRFSFSVLHSLPPFRRPPYTH